MAFFTGAIKSVCQGVAHVIAVGTASVGSESRNQSSACGSWFGLGKLQFSDGRTVFGRLNAFQSGLVPSQDEHR